VQQIKVVNVAVIYLIMWSLISNSACSLCTLICHFINENYCYWSPCNIRHCHFCYKFTIINFTEPGTLNSACDVTGITELKY